MQNLDPITLPLNKSVLIEASAGTGKTFTIANIYLRLLLGIGCKPLTVEQILVVTFTKAATEELKNRIRKNIQQCADFLQDKRNGLDTQSESRSYAKNLDFLEQLYPQVSNLQEALLRLNIAECDIDTASVFTIHGFCQKMLVQFAFESGVRFDLDLQPNQRDLLKKLSEDVWRELFYPKNLVESRLIAEKLSTPEALLARCFPYLEKDLPSLDDPFIHTDISAFLAKIADFITGIKRYWLNNKQEMVGLIQESIQKEQLNGVSYKQESLEKWQFALDKWANDEKHYFPKKELSYFSEDYLAAKTRKGCVVPESVCFVAIRQYIAEYETEFQFLDENVASILTYQFLIALRDKLSAYKQAHPQRSFDDLLIMLNQALKQPNTGQALAQKIRAIYPFAMIDEFQDTDLTQYEIFSQIFMVEKQGNGFIMIGDPKQSIYKFRGADIFTYLMAAKQADEQFTLGKNWRSLPKVVQAVNNLFSFATSQVSPFIYQDIGFHPVDVDNHKGELVSEKGHFVFYCSEKTKLDEVAEICAYQIHQQLKAMKAGKFGIKNENGFTAFAPKDIAILVRKGSHAVRIKNALAKRNIKSVYFSESSSVFSSEIATELCWLLQAGLNPYHSQALLSALGSTLWGLTAAEIYHYKENETLREATVNQFIHYHSVWKAQGVLPMLHKIYLEQGIIERLKGMLNADRLITDLLHLTEILQEKSQSLESEAELVRWYEKQVSSQEDNEQQLRLESEDELIKIVTIHGSKGLQYPIVWLPFAAQKSDGDKRDFGLYRSTQGELSWYFGKNEEAESVIQNEEYAEDLRLFYVALTRAESQLNLVVPKTISGWSPLHYLLSESDIPKSKVDITTYFQRKNISDNPVNVENELPFERWEETATDEYYEAKSFSGNIRIANQITSFSSLYAQHERLSEGRKSHLVDSAQDRDTAYSEIIESDTAVENSPYSPFQFPHGVKVGTILHSFLEHCRFGQPIDKESIAILCERLELDEQWIEPTAQWFEQIFATPIGTAHFCLNEVDEKQCLMEWQFYLRLKNEKALGQLNRLLKQHTPLAKYLPDLQLPQLEGFVRGFVDCIVQMEGKFYLLDYKSNFLGYLPQNYSRENLEKEMGKQRYDLQYLLYTLALHRYLISRLGERYDYERDFGGVAYLFLRAMNGEPGSGIYFDKPSRELIEEMDKLFG